MAVDRQYYSTRVIDEALTSVTRLQNFYSGSLRNFDCSCQASSLYETGKVNPGVAKSVRRARSRERRAAQPADEFCDGTVETLLRYLFVALSSFPHLCAIVSASSSNFLLSSTSISPLLLHVVRFL